MLAQCEREARRLGRLLSSRCGADAAAHLDSVDLAHPTPGKRLESPFGLRLHPILGQPFVHHGLDFAVDFGYPVRAAAGGTVFLVESMRGYGLVTVLDHGDGLATVYAHQQEVAVEVGRSVAVGDVIGGAGSTGVSTGPHLHFEVRAAGVAVDPWPLLARSGAVGPEGQAPALQELLAQGHVLPDHDGVPVAEEQ